MLTDCPRWTNPSAVDLRLNGSANDIRPLPRLPQRDSQIFGSIRLQQRNLWHDFLRKFLSRQGQIHSRTLSLGFKEVFKLPHVQVLRDTGFMRNKKQQSMLYFVVFVETCGFWSLLFVCCLCHFEPDVLILVYDPCCCLSSWMFLVVYLQHSFVVYIVEYSSINLTRFKRHPVQNRHPELGLDRLLNLHSCKTLMEVDRGGHRGWDG